MAERQPSKLHVASSNLVSRSIDSRSTPDAPAGATAALAATGLQLRAAIAGTIRIDPALVALASALSDAYRSGTEPTNPSGHVHDPRTAAAYAAARVPATFAAAARAMEAAAVALPGFAPGALLDVGTGTGATAWAAGAVWPTLHSMILVDRELAMVELGRRFATHGPPALATAAWQVAPAIGEAFQPADLVTASYLLGELANDSDRAALVVRLWAATSGALVLVEPGSRAGFERILAARSLLIGQGAQIVAPCPGNTPCPVRDGPAWCHFLARLDRSPLQRRAKAATRSWEDEPFSYVVAARPPTAMVPAPRVVLGRPRHAPGRVELRICVDGRIDTRTVSRRDRLAWATARDLAWGDPVPGAVLDSGATGPQPARTEPIPD